MVINKAHTFTPRKESSSLTYQRLLFIRRADISPAARLDLAIAGLGRSYRDCAIKDLKQKYDVSHTFIYDQSKILRETFASLFSTLDQIVQASSLVETFNSILKPFINNTRGQVSQELLNLVKFYHNHRVFKRGKRKGKAPIELLTGQKLEQTWIDLLMDKIKAANSAKFRGIPHHGGE